MHHVSIHGHSHPRVPRRPKPPQQHPSGQTRQRKTKATHPAQTQGHSHPRASGGPSRRSSTQQGKRTQRKTKGPGVHVRQDNPTHAGPRAQTTRTRQRRAAQAAQTAVGDAQLRILFRDDHVATTASKRFHRTQRRQKALFFGAYPVSFGKTKEMGYNPPSRAYLTKFDTGRVQRFYTTSLVLSGPICYNFRRRELM